MAVKGSVVRLASLLFLAAGLAVAQYQGQEPQKVSVDELTSMGARYSESPVIVQGDLRYGDAEDTNFNIFELRGDNALSVVRVATARQSFDDLRFMAGQRVEITGIFFDLDSVMMPEQHPVLRYFPGAVRRDAMGMNKQYFIAATGAEIIEEIKSEFDAVKPEDLPEAEEPDIDASSLTGVDLRELVKDPSRYLGKQITVLGKFRGSNLYGDLSIKDKRTPRDFIIKVGESAIWVTGRRPAGKGFRLDPSKRRDTGEWLQVIGEPWESGGTVYLKAAKVELAKDPEDPDLEPVKVRAEEKEAGPPPEVTFTLPIGGDRSVPLDSQFQVQFSKDMKGESFHRNVDLLYADDDGIGNPFPSLEVSYDGPSRTLTVKPNQTLAPEKEIRLILYDSIEDLEGQKLPAEPGAAEIEPGAAVILTFTTAKG